MATVAQQHRTPRAIRNARVAPPALHIGIDATQILFGVSGGVEVYFRTLVRALEEGCHGCQAVIIARPDQRARLQSLFDKSVAVHSPASSAAGVTTRCIRRLRRAFVKSAASESPPAPPFTFRDIERRLRLDVLHSPVQIFSDIEFDSPGVLNLHDLQHVHFPENFKPGALEARRRLYAQSARRASAIIASSDFVRDDIIRHLEVPPEKVHRIPVACNPDVLAGLARFTADDARRQYALPETFAFYPAQFWPHKNHIRLVEALTIVRSRAPRAEFKLVCAGCRQHSGWPALEEALDQFGMRDHVTFLDFIPTEHLAGVYRASLFCVMPSLFEASSYPVIEAQTLGVPAMCSDVTSLSELTTDGAGLLFDPHSAEDIAEKMLRWLNDPADRQDHARCGQRRAVRDHGLESYAARVRDLYSAVIGRKLNA